ncbi:MAG: L,D-transpeptidase [Leptospiraceae bacterium]
MIQYKVLFPSDSPYRPEYHRKMRNRRTLTSFFILGSLLCLQLTFARGLEAEERTGPSSTTSTDENTGIRTENSDRTNGEPDSQKTSEQKALDELTRQLKEMEESVDFPVGPSNRLLTENREAYDKRDLPALAKSLLSRNQLYGIVIWKGKHRLSIFDQRGVEILSFEAGIGGDAQGGQRPKQYEYDGRTPEGIYRIFRFYSLEAPKESESYRELERLNGYYLTAKLGYSLYGKPGKDAGKNVFGSRFYGIDYPAASDIWRYKMALKEGTAPLDKKRKLPMRIGSGIAIHGTNDPASVGQTFGSGCIRLRNEDIEKLDPFVNNGMPVIIFP